MAWSAPRAVLPSGGPLSDLDAGGASSPCVVEASDGSRMWYSADDGSTSRIAVATRGIGGLWERRGVAVDAGFAGETDAYGAACPSVVRTRGGYIMAYAGSDGADTRLHMATSANGDAWEPHGTFMHRGEEDAVGASHPCLLVGNQWWLFYAGFDGTANGRRACIMAAVSANGASWDRVGVVLEPEAGELAVREPSVIVAHGKFHMFYVSEDDTRTRIDLATSPDGVAWERRGTVLVSPHEGGRGVGGPFALHSPDAAVWLWYAGPASSRMDEPDRIWLVRADRLSG
jgi:predicted GH43/DUF377 family glycosyl hydrolase